MKREYSLYDWFTGKVNFKIFAFFKMDGKKEKHFSKPIMLKCDHNVEWRFLLGMWKFTSTSRGLVFLTSCQKVVKKKSANDLIYMMYVYVFCIIYNLFLRFKICNTACFFGPLFRWNITYSTMILLDFKKFASDRVITS